MRAEHLHAHVVARAGDFSIDLTLEARAGVTALLGASGSGKTTVLRCLAGLHPLERGFVKLDGVDLSNAPPERRQVGLVFQSAALFPHLTVLQNVCFSGVNELDALGWLERLRIGSFGGRRPETLSGGEKQRVALARAFASKPKWLLLDEPFSSVDAPLRRALLDELHQLVTQEKLITLLVTHAVEEAERLSATLVPMPNQP